MYSDLPHIVLYPNDLTREKKIQAIKDVRSATQLGLKQAKEIVDKLTIDQAAHVTLYANDYGAYSESHVLEVASILNRSEFFDHADVRRSVPATPTDEDPMRGVAYQAAVLAAIFAAEEGDVALALSKVSTLATVTQDPTFKAAVIILTEADRRLDGLNESPLLGGYPMQPRA